MSILKKIINIFKTKEKRINKDTFLKKENILKKEDNLSKEIINETKDVKIEDIQEKDVEKLNELNNSQIITSLKLINDNVQEDKIEDETVIDIFKEINKHVVNEEIKEIDKINLSEKIDNKLKESLDSIKCVEELESKIFNLKKILKLIKNFKSEIISENVTYENFNSCEQYNAMNRIYEIVKEIEKNNLKVLLEENLGSIYLDFESKQQLLFKEFTTLTKQVNEFLSCIDIFKDEVLKFTNVVNKVNSKIKIEIKADYDKIQRTKKGLEDKREEYIKEEEQINNIIIDICRKIEELTVMFSDVLEYIVLYISEEKTNMESKLNTYTKDKNIKDISKLKYAKEQLNKLMNILQIRKEGL